MELNAGRFAAVLAILLSPVLSAGSEWPQFRGPRGDGRSLAKNLPIVWSEKENLAWKTPIPGRGWSSPVVDARRVWMTTAEDEGRVLKAIGVERESGRIVHEIVVFEPESPVAINPKNSHASPTPVVDEDRVFVSFGAMGTACIQATSGQVLWRNQELQLDHKEGPGSSPVLVDGLLLMTCDGMDVQYVAALDAASGKLAWKTDRSGEMPSNPDYCKAYSTPLVVREGNRPLMISPGADQVIAYDARNGKEVWKVRYKGFSNVPTPSFGHGLFFVSSGYMRPQLLAIRAGGSGEVTDSHVAWTMGEQVPANSSPVLVDDFLYMVSDRGIATCLEARTAEVRWKERLGGNYSASPIEAEGRLYFFAEEGKATVLEASPTYKVLAQNRLDGRCMATPAPVEGALFVRTETHLYRIENRPRSTQ